MPILASQPPLISVVIPVYNRAATILRAVTSALNQTVPPLEVLVVDDGSSDETVKILDRLLDQRVRALRLNCNQGAQHARLKGIAEARGMFIVFLDSDDELLPDSLENRLFALKKSGWSEAIVYGDVIRNGKIDRYEPLVGNVYSYLLKELSLCPYSVMLIPKKCFSVAGFPDPNFPSWQDDDMVLTIGKFFPVIHCGVPVAIMNVEVNSISGNKRAVVEGCRRMVAKYTSDILETHGHFRLLCWQARIYRSVIVAKWCESRLRLQERLTIPDMLIFVLLTGVRISITVMLKPFFRNFYG